MFLAWFDDSPKKSPLDKIDEAVDCYEERFGVAPTLCLVNERDMVAHPSLKVKSVKTVRANNFWLGYEDIAPVAPAKVEIKKGRERRVEAVA